MNKQLSAAELVTISEMTSPFMPMSRRDKLLRFAKIMREHRQEIYIFSNIEYYGPADWDELRHPRSAFALAAADPVFRGAGLTDSSAGAGAKFFELSRDDLHKFSCDCGGLLTNEEMARRIESLA